MFRSIRALVVATVVCGSVPPAVLASDSWQPIKSCAKFHIALPNDSWSRLAVRFGLGEPTLYRLNGASAESFLRVGNRVCVKGKFGSSTTTTTTTTTTSTTTTTVTTTTSLPVAPVLTVGELTACQPVSVSWRGASPDTDWYSLQWVRVSETGAYDFTNSYSMFNVRGTSTQLSSQFNPGATYAIRVFAMRADWDGVWHSTQNVTPHSQVATFTVPGCALPDAGTSTTSTTTSTTTTTTVPPVTLETGFDPNVNLDLYEMAVQSDGRILIGGSFTTVGGVTRKRVARLNSDGSLDTSFNLNADLNLNGAVYAMAVQSDGKILIGGDFTMVGSTTRNRIARLNSDGSLDSTFNSLNNVIDIDASNNNVRVVAVQSDGKIIIGGDFLKVGGQTRNRIARLNSDGSLDTAFNPDANSAVFAAVVQSDGKVIIGGNFSTIGGQTRRYVARLNTDGSLDTFAPSLDLSVSKIAVQSDGKILIGGSFTTVGGVTRNRIARLNSDGSLDTGFNPNVNSNVEALAVQSDGKILIGGWFTAVGSPATTRNYVARLNADGSLDTGFNPNASSIIRTVGVQSDGKIIIGGGFTTVGGTARNRLARLS